VTIVTRFWTGGALGSGDKVDTGGRPGTLPLALPPWTKVRQVNEREIAGSGGRYEQGDLLIGNIRPSYIDPVTSLPGGFTAEDLDPIRTLRPGTQGVEVIYQLRQADPTGTGLSGDFALIEFQRDRAFHFRLVVGGERTTP